MKSIAKFVVVLFILKIVLFLITEGFAIDVIERFYENNNKL